MTFEEFRKANVARCDAAFHPLGSWSIQDWAIAVAGETGEMCNLVKKLKRYETGTNTEKDPPHKMACMSEIGKELADIVTYADLMAARMGMSLEQLVKRKFNEVSMRMDVDILL